MNDDDPFAQGFHVGHVVRGEQDGRAVMAVVFPDKSADAALHGDVEANGGFVEEEDLRAVEQGRGDFAFHAFAQGQVADGFGEQVIQVEQGVEFAEGLVVVAAGDAVDGAVAFKRVGDGDVPHELVALAHDQGDAAEKVFVACVRGVPQDGEGARCWVQQAREHFEGGGFTRAIGA